MSNIQRLQHKALAVILPSKPLRSQAVFFSCPILPIVTPSLQCRHGASATKPVRMFLTLLHLIIRATYLLLPVAALGVAIFLAMFLRGTVLVAVGLPYGMASVMIYRPKVLPLDDPRTQLGFDFQRVEFVTSDGIKIAGWWIPAQQPARRARSDSPDQQW